MIRLQDRLKSLDKERTIFAALTTIPSSKECPNNLPRYHKALKYSDDVKYAGVLIVPRKTHNIERLWKYRMDIPQDAFDSLDDRWKVLNAEVKRILVKDEEALGKKNTEAFNKSEWTRLSADGH